MGLNFWNFFAVGKDGKGMPKLHFLFKAASTPIRRHVKIRGKANPFLPAFTDYFLKRAEQSKVEKFILSMLPVHSWT